MIHKVKQWQFFDAIVTLSAQEEDCAPEDMFENPEDVAFVREAGYLSAWFCATVKVTLGNGGFSGVSSLGCCSYESFEQFVNEPDSYFGDLVQEAFYDLQAQMERAARTLQQYVGVWNGYGA